jgi:hypothetical protein
MFGKLALAILVGVAFLQAPIAHSTLRCCANSESHQAALSDGCCAAMACCVISDGTTEQPITPAPLANELSPLAAPVCLVSLIDFPASPETVRFAKAQPVAHSPPPLALLCTFLI